MKGPLASTVPDKFRPKVATQMAACIQALSTVTFSHIGQIWTGPDLDRNVEITSFQLIEEYLGPFNSSRAYFAEAQREMNEIIYEDHHEDEDWPEWRRSCEIYLAAVPLLICPELRRGPFPLYHPDFHFKNILFDDDFNITGVLDWTGAKAVPWEQFVLLGDVIPFDHLSEKRKAPIIKFRQLFVDALRQIESPSPSGKEGSSVEALGYYDLSLA